MSETAAAPAASRPDANTTVAANIRAELALAGIGQVDLATHLGQNEMWISRRMKGAPAFSTNEVADVADFFGIPVGDLFVYRERRGTAGSIGRRSIYLLGEVGPAGIEPTTSTVESERFTADHFAVVTPLFRTTEPEAINA